MSDKDTQAKGKFEPPPWEREAFDALAARRAEEQATAALLAEAASAAGRAGDTAAIAAEEPLPAEVQFVLEAQAGTEPAAAKAAPAAVDDPAVAAMLAKLQAEERTDDSATKWVGWVASAITFVLGASMLIFGLVAGRDAGGKFANVIGSAVLSIFGLCFMGMALWVWISTTRSRGRR